VKRLLVALVLAGSVVTAPARAEQIPFAPMFKEAAHAWGVPAAWTQAIAHVESGLSPWALNIEGKGYRFDSKEKALAKAKEAEAEGRSFDSGVMQVNNFWLKKYGIPLEAALDPLANIYLGSWILKQEIARHGESWNAVGAYHSPNEDRSRRYAEMVKDALGKGPVKRSVAQEESGTTQRPVEALPAPRRKNVPVEQWSLLVVARGDGNRTVKQEQGQTNGRPFVQKINRRN